MTRINRVICHFLSRFAGQDEEGQTLVEYALIIALVSIGLVAALSLLSTGISNVFSNIEASF